MNNFKKNAWEKLPYILMYFISIMLVGAMAIIQAEFDFERISQLGFWQPILITSFAGGIIFLTRSEEAIGYYCKIDEEIIMYKKGISSLVNNGIGEDFNQYITEEINFKSKKERWLSCQNRKLFKIDKYASSEDLRIYLTGTDIEKEKNRYCRKRKKIMKLIDPVWVDENISFLKVKYEHITYGMLLGGVKNLNKEYRPIFISSKKKMSKVYVTKMIQTFVITTVIHSFVISSTTFGISEFINIITKLGSLLMNYVAATIYAQEYVINNVKEQLLTTVDLLKKYFSWKKREL